MAMTPRPRHRGKADRVIHSGAKAVDLACDYAIAAYDRVAEDMDRKWGVGRLPGFARSGTAAKYGAAVGAMHEAIDNSDADACAWHADNCIRGLEKMDAEAEAAGHSRQDPEIWELQIEGAAFGMIRDARDHEAASELRPDLRIVSLREAIIVFDAYRRVPIVDSVMGAFPDAELMEIRKRAVLSKDELDDPIPF